MTRLLLLILFLIPACAITHKGYIGPGEKVPHATLHSLHHQSSMFSLPFVAERDTLYVEFNNIDKRPMDSDLELPEIVTLTPGMHKVIVEVRAEKAGRKPSKTLMEFDLIAQENTQYFIKGEMGETMANIWIEDSNGRVVMSRMPAVYDSRNI